MKTLELTPYTKAISNIQSLQSKLIEKKAAVKPIVKNKFVVKAKSGSNVFSKEVPENLTFKEIVIRSLLVFMLPLVIDFSHQTVNTNLIYIVIPIICYLAVTVFTMRDPVKAFFTKVTVPAVYQ